MNMALRGTPVIARKSQGEMHRHSTRITLKKKCVTDLLPKLGVDSLVGHSLSRIQYTELFDYFPNKSFCNI
eukprot:SAG11_NODE_2072_length_3859_cov_3.296809_1_plen_71_part_00